MNKTLPILAGEVVSSKYPTWLRCSFWVIFQIGIILILESFGFRPSRFIPGCSSFGGPAGGICAMSFYATCFFLCIVYTWLGIILSDRLGINSPKWWRLLIILYVAYAAICTLGLYFVIGEWFFDGFGAYAADVCFAPLLWLGELELMCLLKKKMFGKTPNLIFSSLFWMIAQASCIMAFIILGLFPMYYIHPTMRLGYNGFSSLYVYSWSIILEIAFTIIGCMIVFNEAVNSKRWWQRLGGLYLLYLSISSAIMLSKMGYQMCNGYWLCLTDIWLLPILWWAEIQVINLIHIKRVEKAKAKLIEQ